MKIAVIEDEAEIRAELEKLLKRYGYDVFCVEDFTKTIEDMERENPNLILLDIHLPYKDGFCICREIREKMTNPIIMLTSQNSDLEEVMSLQAGADDFVGKPYNPQVLLAHIEAVLKRSGAGMDSNRTSYKNVTLDSGRGVLEYNGTRAELTKNEIRILNLLMKKPGEIVSREEIMEELWQDGQFVDENTLNVNIMRLRKKLTEMGLEDFLETKRGMGYRI
ncbi:MAG: response regulator transcription factor [Lachnospiraceae bacterium]|nr:response regulator transcription factor [Lachnospiraceae bacterium]